MKITKRQLRKIIKEELSEVYGGALGPFPGRYNKKRPSDASAGDTVEHEQEPELGQGQVLAVGPQGTLVKWANFRRLHDPRVLKVVLRRATWATIAGLDEKELTKPEKKEKERLVKGMKKDASGFEERYPGRGEEVMYATATKQAKKRK